MDWFKRSARDLPWRRCPEPWPVWLSEALLQQTRVATALDYYHRLIARYPDVQALARGKEEELLGLWSGLGYYRRARSLRAAAIAVVERHGGRIPDGKQELLALPGVGPYTAGALLSIAFGQAEPLVDGNVARVFARLFLLEQPIGTAALDRELWALARAHLPAAGRGPRGPGAWNQALMELGATVCTPARPSCAACPLAPNCQALAAGRQAELPHPKARPEPIDVEVEMLVVRGPRGLLLERRAGGGRMEGLLELPTRELGENNAPAHLWPRAFRETRLVPQGDTAALGTLRHAITRHRIRARLVLGSLVGAGQLPQGFGWWTDERLAEAPLSGLTRKALAQLS